MGLQQREGSGGNAEFYKINGKEGCFQVGSGENKKKFKPGDVDLMGTLIGFKVDAGTDPEGKPKEEVRLIFRDVEAGKPNMHVSIGIDSEANGPSAFGLKVLSKLCAADLTKAVTLMPWFMPKGTKLKDSVTEKDTAGVAVYQDGNQLREDYGNGVVKLPELPSQTFGSKTIYDKTPWGPILDNLLDTLHARLTPTPEVDDHVDADAAAGAAEAAAAAAPSPAAPASNRSAFRTQRAA